jgi:transcriptional antiterminator RfaH
MGLMNKRAERTKEEKAPAVEVHMGPAWYVVCAQAGRERTAREHLERQRYEVYLPMRLHLDRKGELVARPFFPRFMFVRLDLLAQPWRPILSTVGVRSMMMSGDHPMWIKAKHIDRLKAQEEGGFIKLCERPQMVERFKEGQAVRLSGFGLDMLEATFSEPVDEARVAILVSLFGRDSRVVVDRDQITQCT